MFYKKLLGAAFAVILIGVLFAPRVGFALLSTSELQAQINALLQKVQALQDQLNGLNSPAGSPLIYGRTLNGGGGAGGENTPGSDNKRTNPSFYNTTNASGTAVFCHDFNIDLTVGSAGAEVTALKYALGREGIAFAPDAAASDTFDESVAAAVVQFQAKYGIRQTGYVGPLTRGRLNRIYGCNAGNVASSGNGQFLNPGLKSGHDNLYFDNGNSSDNGGSSNLGNILDNKRTNPSFYNTTNATGTAAYSLTINPSSLSFTVLSNALDSPSPAGWQITLTNYPDTGVTVTKTYTGQLATGSDWLSVGALTGSGVTKTIMVTPAPVGLGVGIYTASIAISANGQTVTVPVTLTVSAPPTQQSTLSFSQNSFSFNYVQGGTIPALQISIFTNTSNANVYYRISVPSQPTWLNSSYAISLLTATPGNPNMIGASVNPLGLNPGTYTTNIILTGNFVGSPVTIPVTLTVAPSSVVTVQPYFTQNGAQTTSLVCGTPLIFNVPGYSQVWLSQTKTAPNGVVSNSFNNTYAVPSAPYSPDCTRDLGNYANTVYTVVNGGQGQFLGTVVATIGAAATLQITSPNGGENWQAGTTHQITWTSTGYPANTQVQILVYDTRYGQSNDILGLGSIITSIGSGSYTINVPSSAPAGSTYRAQVSVVTSPLGLATGQSNSTFTIMATPTSVVTVQPYFTQNGAQTTSLVCGTPIIFNVPGYSQVWLVQTKNGAQGYNGVYSVPSAPYSPSCTTDLGTYKNDVYTVVNGGQGQFIGTVTATIGASIASPGTAAPISLSPLVLPDGYLRVAYNQTLTVSGGDSGSFVWSLAGSTLPDGLSLDTSKTGPESAIIGTPSLRGTYSFSVKVFNGKNNVTQNYTLSVYPVNGGGGYNFSPSAGGIIANSDCYFYHSVPDYSNPAAPYGYNPYTHAPATDISSCVSSGIWSNSSPPALGGLCGPDSISCPLFFDHRASVGPGSAVSSVDEKSILSQQASVLAAMASLLEKLGSLLLGR